MSFIDKGTVLWKGGGLGETIQGYCFLHRTEVQLVTDKAIRHIRFQIVRCNRWGRETGRGCIKAFNLGQNGRRFCSLTLWHCVRKFLRAMKMKIIRQMIDTKPKMMFGGSFDIHFLSVSSFWHWSLCVVLRVTEPLLTSLKELESYLSEDLTVGNVAWVNERRKKGKNYRIHYYFVFTTATNIWQNSTKGQGTNKLMLAVTQVPSRSMMKCRSLKVIEESRANRNMDQLSTVCWSITHS